MERAGTITALIAARVILIVITLSILPADGRTALGADAPGKAYPSTGPKTERQKLAVGSTLLIPKASIVTIRY